MSGYECGRPPPPGQAIATVKIADTYRLRFLVGVFLTCMCSLMLQIMETRALSVISNYTLAFFAIGVAMLGMTAGALLVFYRFEPIYSPAQLSDAMARVITYFAWSVLGSLGVLLKDTAQSGTHLGCKSVLLQSAAPSQSRRAHFEAARCP